MLCSLKVKDDLESLSKLASLDNQVKRFELARHFWKIGFSFCYEENV